MHFTKSSYYLYLYSTSPVILQTKKRNPLPLQNLRKQKLVILRFLRPVNNLLRQEKSTKVSIPIKQAKASRKIEYLDKIIACGRN